MIQRIASQEGCGSARARFASAAAAGLLVLAQCTPQMPSDVNEMIAVRARLLERPATLTEELGENSQSDLNGKITICRGSQSCTIDVYPGDILLSVRFNAEREGRMEVAVTRTGDPGVSFEQRTEFQFGGMYYDYQTVRTGERARLFNTDITISVGKGEAGRFYLNLE